MSTYNYTISQTANNKLNVDRLCDSIRKSNIIIALDSITVIGENIHINFRSNLSTDEITMLNNIIATHTGEPLVQTNFKINPKGELVVAPSAPYGTKYTYVSHNWCDKTTWYQNSVLVENVIMEDSGNHIDYTLPEPQVIIDVTHMKISDESTEPSIKAKKPIVKVNNVTYVENYYKGITKITPSNGYDINYNNGTVTFNNPLDETDEVKITYYTLPLTDEEDEYGVRQSAFSLMAPEGKTVVLKFAEVQWSKDARMTDAFRFIPFYITGKDPEIDAILQLYNINLPDGTHIPLTLLDPALEKRFENVDQLVDDSDGAYEIKATPEDGRTIRDLAYDMTVFIFNYQGTNNMILDEPKGKYIRIWLKDDVELVGSRATVTIYGTIV